jgi:hypothetical protein
MPPDPPASVADLTDGERYMVLQMLAEEHPRVFNRLLGKVGNIRESAAARARMAKHPFTQPTGAGGLIFCYWRSEDTPCLRREADPLHVTEAGHA